MSFWNLSISIAFINLRISAPPPLTPPTRGGGKTFPPPRWGRSGGGAELLLHLIDFFVSVICNTLIEHPCSLLLIMFRIWKNKHGQTIPVQNIQGHDLSMPPPAYQNYPRGQYMMITTPMRA